MSLSPMNDNQNKKKQQHKQKQTNHLIRNGKSRVAGKSANVSGEKPERNNHAEVIQLQRTIQLYA